MERDCERALSVLAEDICWFGTSDQEDVHGLAGARAYIQQEIESIPTPYQLSIYDETYVPISGDSGEAFFRMKMENEGVAVTLRVTGASRVVNGIPKICTMHFSVADDNQQPDEYFPLAKGREKIAREKRELVFSTMSGGLMGGYLKPGFPLYFIDDRLLQYLGYASEAEFSLDIDGLVSNAMHPDDRALVNEALARQLAVSNRYTVDYRMRKRDGTYLWIHDIGRTSTSENGEDVIISVCYDITEQHQKQVQLDNLVNSLPGGVALYRLENNDCKVLYQSQGLSKIVGMTQEEYKNQVESCVTNAIYAGDADKVLKALDQAANSEETVSVDFRVVHVSGHTIWLNGSYKRTATENGCPIIHAVFSEMPQMRELLGSVVENSGVAIVVSDDDTRELLYVNREALSIYHKTDPHYEGKRCYEYLMGYDKPCDFCRSQQGRAFERQPRELYLSKLGRHYMTQSRTINWAGHDAHIEYLTDITETKKAQQQFCEMLQNVTCGIVVCDADAVHQTYHIQYMNEGFCSLFEGTEEELRARYEASLFQNIYPEDIKKAESILQRLIQSKSHAEGDFRVVFPDGRIKFIWLSIKAVIHTDGTATTYSTYYNITEQVEQEQQLHDILNLVPGGVCLYRWDGKKLNPLVVSKQFSELLGEDAEKRLSAANGLEYSNVHLDDLSTLQKAILDAFDTTGKIECTYRLYNSKLGEYRWVNMQGVAVPQADGTQLAYVSYADITEERLMAQKLWASERALDIATEEAGLWYWKFDPDKGRAYYNPKSMRDFGLPAIADNYPQSWLDSGFVLPEYHKAYRDAVEQIKQGIGQAVFEARTILPDGKSHWAEFRFTNLPPVDGQDRMAVCTARLIDFEKSLAVKYEMERQKPTLGEQNLLFHAIFNLDTDKTLEYGQTGVKAPLLKQLPTFHEAVRYVAECVVGADAKARLLALNDITYLKEQIRQGNLTLSEDYRRKLPNGHTLWVRNILHLILEPTTKQWLLFEYCYDIHDQKMAEEVLLLASSHDYERIACVDLAHNTMVQYGKYGDLVPNQVVDYEVSRRQYADQMIAPDERDEFLLCCAPEMIINRVAADKAYMFMSNLQKPDGTVGVVKTRYVPYDEENRIYIMTRTDVTALLREEEAKNAQMKEALSIAQQANRAKTDFLASMSHDIRTPMNAIMGMCELALQDEKNPEQVHESLDTIRSSSQILLDLLNNILDMSRIENGKMQLERQNFSMTEQVHKTAQSYRALALQKQQIFKLHVSIKHDRCVGDIAKIHRAIDNILSNAIKYTPCGGTVAYRISEITSQKAEIGRYRFEISDTGIGIPPEAQSHLFEPFYRASNSTQAAGTGLGLSIAKAIVDLKGGTISVKSVKGGGTTFTVELPVPLADQEKTPRHSDVEESEPKVYDLSGIRILLCEDHPVNQKVAIRILEKAGAAVTVVENGQVGVETFVHQPENTFDLILMDIRMPVMDGNEAAKAIRASSHPQAKTIPIIAMTANAFAEDVQRSMAAGMNAHLAKPIIPQQLYRTVWDCICDKGQARGGSV
ncbi:MAG: PAS domain-containing protein [Oscillibacter sp.]|nr:PAS domain-containing protein [Oscillibacter sp.]